MNFCPLPFTLLSTDFSCPLIFPSFTALIKFKPLSLQVSVSLSGLNTYHSSRMGAIFSFLLCAPPHTCNNTGAFSQMLHHYLFCKFFYLFPLYFLIPKWYKNQLKVLNLFYHKFYCTRLLKNSSFLNNHHFLFPKYFQRNISFCHLNWKLTTQSLMKVHVICSINITELVRWNPILNNTAEVCIYQRF